MQTVLMVIHLFVAIALTVVVLLQKSEGGALGMGGGGSGMGGFFSQRGAANTLTRTTAILGIVFFLTSLSLTWLALQGSQTGSILDSEGQPAAPASTPGTPSRMPRPATPPPGPATAPAPAAPAPAAPAPAPAP
jgi:preprotein translocase subunit SecG